MDFASELRRRPYHSQAQKGQDTSLKLRTGREIEIFVAAELTSFCGAIFAFSFPGRSEKFLYDFFLFRVGLERKFFRFRSPAKNP